MPTDIARRTGHTFRLACAIAWNAIVVRNERSVLGVIWYLLNPLLLFLVMYGVHLRTPLSSVRGYAFYLATGLLCYSMFRGITTAVSRSFVSSAPLIRNVNIPKAALCLGRLFEALFVHAVEIVVLFCAAAWFGVTAHMVAYLVPFFSFMLFAFAIGYALAVAAVYINDAQNIWNFAMMALIFLSPIFYYIPVGNQPWYIRYNPLTLFVDASRDALIKGAISWREIGTLSVLSIVAVIVGYAVHRSRLGTEIAENI